MATAYWTPDGFDEWQRHFPNTEFASPPKHLDRTQHFLASWQTRTLGTPRSTLVVLIAGLFSEWLPRCFLDCTEALRNAGYEVLRIPVRSSRGVIAQGAKIGEALNTYLKPGRRFVVLAHSKGGIDTLAGLVDNCDLLSACDGVALVQPPVGPSSIVDSLLGCGQRQPCARYPLDGLRRALIKTPWSAAGARDISSVRDPRVAGVLNNLPATLHCLHAISWSAIRRSCFDTHHERLNASRPGCAHDGQFYLESQLLEGLPFVGVPQLDHGQPMLGGGGFDPARFWLALMDVLHETQPTIHAQTR